MNDDSIIRILHVDDDKKLLKMVSRLLERKFENLKVESVSDTNEAIERLEEDEFECIVSDYQMPKIDGLDFYSVLKNREIEVPFILYTGEGTENVKSRAYFLGVSGYVEKNEERVAEKLGNKILEASEVPA